MEKLLISFSLLTTKIKLMKGHLTVTAWPLTRCIWKLIAERKSPKRTTSSSATIQTVTRLGLAWVALSFHPSLQRLQLKCCCHQDKQDLMIFNMNMRKSKMKKIVLSQNKKNMMRSSYLTTFNRKKSSRRKPLVSKKNKNPKFRNNRANSLVLLTCKLIIKHVWRKKKKLKNKFLMKFPLDYNLLPKNHISLNKTKRWEGKICRT